MERGEGLPTSVEGLRVEVLRLRQELEQTSQEKIQAAEYGLQVLEEKQLILQQYEELEALFEVTNRELDLAKEVGNSCGRKSDDALMHPCAERLTRTSPPHKLTYLTESDNPDIHPVIQAKLSTGLLMAKITSVL
ncbi:negative regulation of phospholipase C-activating G-protein coupled receptor signaling pathway [Branchiostoma belcheri]|nr:negative regulation of phospholipase C-activating G-protein coupled receptor signaling pathway [Branchiostoma belcheri]